MNHVVSHAKARRLCTFRTLSTVERCHSNRTRCRLTVTAVGGARAYDEEEQVLSVHGFGKAHLSKLSQGWNPSRRTESLDTTVRHGDTEYHHDNEYMM